MGMMYSRGLIAGYPFENTANDILGVNNGTVNGATYVDGQCGRALSFDGVDDYALLPITKAELSATGSFSIVMRLKAGGLKVGNAGIFSIANTQFDIAPWIYFNKHTTTSILVFVSGNYRSALTIPYTIGQWLHIALTYAGGVWTTYKNAQFIGSFTGFIGLDGGNNTYLASGYTRVADMIVDNLQLYNRALNVNELKKLYLNLGI